MLICHRIYHIKFKGFQKKKEKIISSKFMESLLGGIIAFISVLMEAQQMFLKSNLMNVNRKVSVTSGNLVYFPQSCGGVTSWEDYTILSSNTLIPGN